MRFRLFTLLFLLTAIFSFQFTLGQGVVIKRSTVIENYKGKPYYIHFVNQGETLTAIAKAYNVTIEELNAENPTIEKGLQTDMVLRIPQKAMVVIPESGATEIEKQKELPKVADVTIAQSKPEQDPDYILYKVKKQETLYGISKQFNLTVDDIKNANPGLEVLQDGMEIKIPKKKSSVKPGINEVPAEKAVAAELNPDEIVVKTGETLYSIGKAHNISVDDLIDLNPQLSGGLKAGMVLKLRKTDPQKEALQNVKKEPVVTGLPLSLGDCFDKDNIKTRYQVALLLPFLLDDANAALDAPVDKDPSDFKSFNYFQFYAGFMLAADSLEKYGFNARIQVLDADKVDDTLTIRQTLRKPGMDKMDLLIGPMYATSFSIAARFAKKHEIGIINPLSRRESICKGNPYVIKTQVSDSGIASKLTSFISSQYPQANILAVRNDKKEMKSLTDDFSSLIKTGIADHTFKGTFQEVNYSTEMIAGVKKKLKPGVKNIVIFFSNNKSAVPNFISLLNQHVNANDIILIGMDGWDELDLETEFLVNLNFHQLTTNYIDYESEAVQQFCASFRNKYGAVPLSTKHAYLGFDIGWYFLTSLMWYGDKYVSCLPDYKGTGLQNNFSFSGSGTGNGLQNNDINIVKLQDYKLVKVE